MKCEACHKQEATVAYTHVVEDAKRTIYMCEACVAKQKGGQPPKAEMPKAPTMAKKVKVELKQMGKTAAAPQLQCSGCGMSYEEFKKTGRFGCHLCYEAFAGQLERLMKRIHGAVDHRGKGLVEQQERLDPEAELRALRQELDEAVSAEAYERAAKLRDRIRELEAMGARN